MKLHEETQWHATARHRDPFKDRWQTERKLVYEGLGLRIGDKQWRKTYSLHPSMIAGLIGSDKTTVKKMALLDFLQYGLQYVFPERPGAITRGMPTAHSAPPLKGGIMSNDHFVWPFAEGKLRGQAIEPLHPNIPEACLKDPGFYEMIALVDGIRMGKARERKLALEMLKERLKNA